MTTDLPRCFVIAETAPGCYQVLHANGSEAEARRRAAEWLADNPKATVHIALRDDTARIERRLAWIKA